MKKRILALLLTLALLISVMPMALADEGNVAQIGQDGYDSLDEAIVAAGEGDTITLKDGTHTLTNGDIEGKNITIKGGTGAVVEMRSIMYTRGSTINFEGITVEFGNTDFCGLVEVPKLTFTDCVLNGQQTLYAPDVVFTDCTFNATGNYYNIWTWGAKNATFTDCTFNTDGKAVLVYGGGPTDVTLTNCDFNATTCRDKAAVETGNDYNATYTLTLNNCTADENFVENPKGTPTGTNLWANKNSMDFDHVTVTIDGEEVTVPNYIEKKAIDDAAEEAKGAIEELSYLSEKRKAELKEAIDAAAEEAKANIGDAETEEAVEAAVDAGLDAIADIMAQAEKENKAIIALGQTVIFGGAAGGVRGFTDVDGHWAEAGIEFCVDEGLMNGVGDDKFAPEAATTRGMIMTILARMSGENTAYSYPWYQAGMEWAVWNGVSDGTNPEGVITREQLAAMLWRYVGSPETAGSLTAFGDADSVSEYAESAMAWAVEEGLINGINDNLVPQGTATRAQVATIFMRLCRNVLFF